MPPLMPLTHDWVGVTEAAELIGLSAYQTRLHCREGKLPAQIYGSMYLIHRSDLEAYLREREKKEQEKPEPVSRSKDRERRTRERTLRSLAARIDEDD